MSKLIFENGLQIKLLKKQWRKNSAYSQIYISAKKLLGDEKNKLDMEFRQNFFIYNWYIYLMQYRLFSCLPPKTTKVAIVIL